MKFVTAIIGTFMLSLTAFGAQVREIHATDFRAHDGVVTVYNPTILEEGKLAPIVGFYQGKLDVESLNGVCGVFGLGAYVIHTGLMDDPVDQGRTLNSNGTYKGKVGESNPISEVTCSK